MKIVKCEVEQFYNELYVNLFNISCEQYLIMLCISLCYSIHKREMYNVFRRAADKPCDSYLRDDICITRLRFKYVFRRCKLLDETARADAIAKSQYRILELLRQRSVRFPQQLRLTTVSRRKTLVACGRTIFRIY